MKTRMDDKKFFAHWKDHPGRNFRYIARGRRYYERSRWVPHVGAKEAARHAGRTRL